MRPVLALAFAAFVANLGLTSAPPAWQSDLDQFMAAVLERRDDNWKKLQQYILDERERVAVRGPALVPVWGQEREYSWFIEDGFFVRSPTRADGVEISDADRRTYEAEYLRRAKRRDAREKARTAREETGGTGEAASSGVTAERVPEDTPDDPDALLRQVQQPQFVDSAYFLKFRFEQGTYALVGREVFEGRDVLRIEYYPTDLFSDGDERRNRDRPQDELENTIERMMNKVSLVTLWVEPELRQIVKYTFDNVNLDFLPAAWLVRITDLKASMTMGQPFPDVWLPRDLEFYFSAMLALGSFDVRYELSYFDYREAITSGRIRRTSDR